MEIQELREALGRLVFVHGALQWDRPSLAPLLAFLARHRGQRHAAPPLYACTVLEWPRQRLMIRRAHPVLRRVRREDEVLRVDAKADGDHVAVGG